MRGVTIRQLQIFATAAAHLSFARTSEQLHLTQAAVSIQVKQLEDLVGLALFERRGRKVHLTEAGERLVRSEEGSVGEERGAMGRSWWPKGH